MSEKKTMFKISPELNDGDYYGVCKTKEQLMEAVSNWADEALTGMDGYDCSVETVLMTDEEFDAIPEN